MKDLQLATKPFTTEDPRRSATAAVLTFAALGGLAAAAAAPLPLLVRVAASLLEGLVIVRAFCLFHDVQHGALLRGSKPWRALFWCFGELILVPPSVWRQTHNYHHAHTAQLVGSHIGSYALLTPRMYAALPPRAQALYRAARHPVTIACALVTVFFIGMCLRPFLRAPTRHFEALLSMALVIGLAVLCPFEVFALAWLVPMTLATAVGAYLFYAQHNFPAARIATREQWTWTGAALESSSYMEMGPLMRWFTANIGFHHVHHLNPAIPFYRLPEAMNAIPALQSPGRTGLTPKEIAACLRLKLWEPDSGHMVGWHSP